MNRKPLLAVAAFACVSFSFAAAGAERLNVKTGLWEIESLTQMGGTLPLSKDLKARLTPAQIAKMQADWKAETAKGPERDVSKECITEKDIEKPFHSVNQDGCRETFVSTSRTAQEVRLVCDGERKGSGVLKISTPTPQSMTGTLDMKFGEGGEVFTMKGTLKGRWLSDDCGDEAEDDDYASDEDDEPADDPEDEE